VVREDIGINPNIQKAMASGAYRPGRLSLEEFVVHRIAQRVLDRVIGPDEQAQRREREGTAAAAEVA
jgi:choline monooxygenase